MAVFWIWIILSLLLKHRKVDGLKVSLLLAAVIHILVLNLIQTSCSIITTYTLKSQRKWLGARCVNRAACSDVHRPSVYSRPEDCVYISHGGSRNCNGTNSSTLAAAPAERFTGVWDRQQRGADQSNVQRQTWLRATSCVRLWSLPAPRRCCADVLHYVAFVCIKLLGHNCLDSCPFYLSKLNCTHRKSVSPSIRCYKLLARPAARPREPDLAAPRLRRVKGCTQRSSLHLYAPYIGRLLLQPTGTWLLAS